MSLRHWSARWKYVQDRGQNLVGSDAFCHFSMPVACRQPIARIALTNPDAQILTLLAAKTISDNVASINRRLTNGEQLEGFISK